MSLKLRNPFYTPAVAPDIQYVVIQPFATITRDPIQDDLVDRLKDLILEGYKISASTASLDGAVHYVLIR
jgi:hypothetical protein